MLSARLWKQPTSNHTRRARKTGQETGCCFGAIFKLFLIWVSSVSTPASLRISFNPACLCDGYTAYDGSQLFVNGTSGPDISALVEHWEFFQSCLSIDNEV